MDLIFSGFTTDRILINLQSKFFNASAPTDKKNYSALISIASAISDSVTFSTTNPFTPNLVNSFTHTTGVY